jgi:hypothetical protein
MLRRICGFALMLAAVACPLGCGTIENLRNEEAKPFAGMGGRRIYGGTCDDLAMGTYFLLTPSPLGWGVATFYLADAPLSLVGDTATLPWTIGAACAPRSRDASEHPTADKGVVQPVSQRE